MRVNKTAVAAACVVYLAESLLAPRGHTHVHLAVLGAVGGGRRVVEALLQILHPRQQLGDATQREESIFYV